MDTDLITLLCLVIIQGKPHLSSLQVTQDQNGGWGTGCEGWVRVCVCVHVPWGENSICIHKLTHHLSQALPITVEDGPTLRTQTSLLFPQVLALHGSLGSRMEFSLLYSDCLARVSSHFSLGGVCVCVSFCSIFNLKIDLASCLNSLKTPCAGVGFHRQVVQKPAAHLSVGKSPRPSDWHKVPPLPPKARGAMSAI